LVESVDTLWGKVNKYKHLGSYKFYTKGISGWRIVTLSVI
jgi:hypothetical protein